MPSALEFQNVLSRLVYDRFIFVIHFCRYSLSECKYCVPVRRGRWLVNLWYYTMFKPCLTLSWSGLVFLINILLCLQSMIDWLLLSGKPFAILWCMFVKLRKSVGTNAVATLIAIHIKPESRNIYAKFIKICLLWN